MPIYIKIREYARERKLSQSKLSRRADMDIRAVQRLYRNPYANITLETLEKLAVALEVLPNDLIEYRTVKEQNEEND
jgi:DNA-binding Xre family transcriptional regulator